MLSLSDVTLRSLKPTEGQVTYWDKSLKHFGIRVSPGGTMTWTLLVGLERQRIKLGNYPTIGLKDARELARHKLAEITLGQHRKASKTFADALVTFEATHCKNLRPSSSTELRRLLRKHFLPKLGKKQLADLQPHHITDITDTLTGAAAWHAHAAVSTFLNWAVPRYIKVSPLAGVKKPPVSTPRARVLSDAELKCVWRACEQTRGAVAEEVVNNTQGGGERPPSKARNPTTDRLDSSENSPRLSASFATIVKLLILTGQRRGEIAALRPEYLCPPSSNNVHATCVLPAQLTKNGKEHQFPIGKICNNLLMPLVECQTTLLFPARNKSGQPFSGWSKAKALLDEISGVTGWTLHDLRRTFATRLAEMGVAPHVIERLLNHISGTISGVSAVYNRAKYQAEMREAIDLWEAHLQRLLAD